MAKVDGLSSYPIVQGQFDDAEENDTVKKPYRNGGEKHDVLQEFFGCGDEDDLVTDGGTSNAYLVGKSAIVTKSDTDDADLVGIPAVDYDGETNGTLFRRCFSLIGIRITSPMDGSKRNRTSVDAYGEMMRTAKIWKTYGRSSFRIQCPNEDSFYLVNTAHDFGHGLNFQSHWTTLEKGKELVAYKVCKYFGFPNPYPVSWLVKSDVAYVEKRNRLQELRSYQLGIVNFS